MRVNVYTEELYPFKIGEDRSAKNAEIVRAEYVSSRTGQLMTNYGLRIYLRSHPDLHDIPGRDDDRSAVTFWCGPEEKNCFLFLEEIGRKAFLTAKDPESPESLGG